MLRSNGRSVPKSAAGEKLKLAAGVNAPRAGNSNLATPRHLLYFWSSVNKRTQAYILVDGECAGTAVCPLSRVKAGTVVCIKQLAASPEIRARLREMGLGEQ